MKSLKKVAAGSVCALLVAFGAAAQGRSETSVEGEYLSSVEDVVITELANSDEYDNKLVSLQFLTDAVDEGRVTPDMMRALDHLAGEGINSQSRTKGRLMNNYPDIRAKACDLLAKVPTEESATTLKNIAMADNEPMVITAAIRALGEIGPVGDDKSADEAVKLISFVNRRNNVLNPTSSMALEVVIAYEKLADKTEDTREMIQSLSTIAQDYRYAKSVRERARKLFEQLRSSGK